MFGSSRKTGKIYTLWDSQAAVINDSAQLKEMLLRGKDEFKGLSIEEVKIVRHVVYSCIVIVSERSLGSFIRTISKWRSVKVEIRNIYFSNEFSLSEEFYQKHWERIATAFSKILCSNIFFTWGDLRFNLVACVLNSVKISNQGLEVCCFLPDSFNISLKSFIDCLVSNGSRVVKYSFLSPYQATLQTLSIYLNIVEEVMKIHLSNCPQEINFSCHELTVNILVNPHQDRYILNYFDVQSKQASLLFMQFLEAIEGSHYIQTIWGSREIHQQTRPTGLLTLASRAFSSVNVPLLTQCVLKVSLRQVSEDCLLVDKEMLVLLDLFNASDSFKLELLVVLSSPDAFNLMRSI